MFAFELASFLPLAIYFVALTQTGIMRENEVGTFWVNKRGRKTFTITNPFLKFSLIRLGWGASTQPKQDGRSSCYQT